MSILKRGLKGAPVKRLQEKLGVDADGDFGPGTEKAVKEFQSSNGLSVDGIAGPDTFIALDLPELVLLRVGSKGDTVKKMQQELGIDADGKFGPGTKAAVITFQESNGLAADGMAGPATLAKMTIFTDTVPAAAVENSKVKSDEEHFESEDLPEIDGAAPVQGSAAEAAPEQSVWAKSKAGLARQAKRRRKLTDKRSDVEKRTTGGGLLGFPFPLPFDKLRMRKRGSLFAPFDRPSLAERYPSKVVMPETED